MREIADQVRKRWRGRMDCIWWIGCCFYFL